PCLSSRRRSCRAMLPFPALLSGRPYNTADDFPTGRRPACLQKRTSRRGSSIDQYGHRLAYFAPAPTTVAMRGLTDICVNLSHDSSDRDRAEVIARAADAGVTRMIVTGTSVTASVQAAALAATDTRLFATAGVHP